MNIFSWVRRAPVLAAAQLSGELSGDRHFVTSKNRALPPTFLPPGVVPYDNGPPILSPWCAETGAGVAAVSKSQCPYLTGPPLLTSTAKSD